MDTGGHSEDDHVDKDGRQTSDSDDALPAPPRWCLPRRDTAFHVLNCRAIVNLGFLQTVEPDDFSWVPGLRAALHHIHDLPQQGGVHDKEGDIQEERDIQDDDETNAGTAVRSSPCAENLF
jgi:hypothetical protein